MAFDFDITPGSLSPIFRQIVDQVRLGVATGALSAGDQLPSVRALAEKLLVNPNTIAKAYGELTRDGFIEGQPGRGVFVARPRQIYTKAERMRRLSTQIDAAVNEGLSLGFGAEEIVAAVRARLEGVNNPEQPKRKQS
jgi:GntR family transcriptional regulator